MSEMHPAFVLHRTAYRDTSWMLHLFTPDAGRLVVLAKGARQKKRRFSVNFEPLTPMLVSWVGRSNLKTLSQAEPSGASFRMGLAQQYCAYYLNELLLHLLPEHQDSPTLFAAYLDALSCLPQAAEQHDMEWILRVFERMLLTQLGFAVDCTQDAHSRPIDPISHYHYQPQIGWQKITALPSMLSVQTPLSAKVMPSTKKVSAPVLGEVILHWHNNQKTDAVRRLAKSVLCGQIQRLLGRRPLKSRLQWQQLQKQLGLNNPPARTTT